MLGASFMHNYLSIFDMENQQVGLVTLSTQKDHMSPFVRYGIYAGAVLMVVTGMSVLYIVNCRKKYQESDDDVY